MDQIEKEVVSWHKDTFPNANEFAVTDKFFEELSEFEGEIIFGDEVDIFSDKAMEEFADMCIAYMSGLNRFKDKSLSELIQNKLEINKKRQWGEETENGDRPRMK